MAAFLFRLRAIMPGLIWGLAASIFFLEYMLRVSPRASLGYLQKIFNASRVELSSFSAFFLLSYVLMQIPVGLMVDRFGAKKCLGYSTLVFAGMSGLFAQTEVLWIAQSARFLQGFAAAFVFISTLKLVSTWFAAKWFSILVGVTQGLGMVGAALGPSIILRLEKQYGYSNSIYLLAIELLILGVCVLLFIPNKSLEKPMAETGILKSLKGLISDRTTWFIALCAGLFYLPTGILGELWGGYFLSQTYQLSEIQANDLLSLIFLGWIVGGPLTGAVSNMLGRRKVLLFCAWVTLILTGIVLYWPFGLGSVISLVSFGLLLFSLGVANSCAVVTYTMASEWHRPEMQGVALGFVNGLSVAVTLVCQPIVGGLLDYSQTLLPSANELKWALSLLLLGGIITVGCAWMTQETSEKFRKS